MEDNTNRLDKTLADLTAKDVIIIGIGVVAARAAVRTFQYASLPTLRKWNKKLKEKQEELRPKEDHLEHGQYL